MYTLFTAENCTQYAQFETFITDNKVGFIKVNVNQSTERPPVQIFGFPAPFAEAELLGYCSDIIDYVKKNLKLISLRF